MTTKQQPRIEMALPSKPEYECAVIGTVVNTCDFGTYDQLSFLRPDDFYKDDHRIVWTAIESLVNKRGSLDLLSVTEEVKDLGHGDIFERDYNLIYDMMREGAYGASDTMKYYARVIKQLSGCRQIIFAQQEVTQLAFEGKFEEAQQALEKIAYGLRVDSVQSELTPVRDLSTDFVVGLEQRTQHQKVVTGVPSGISDLDRLSSGFQKSDFDIIAARPAIGKTSAALTFARNAAIKHDRCVVLFSLEMSKEQLYQRLVAMEAGIDLHRLRTGWIDDEEWERIVAAIETLNKADIFIDDTPGITPEQIQSKLRALASAGVQPDIAFIDYIQLMQVRGGDNNKRPENRVQEVSEISRKLKGVARELNIPIIALAQLSRAVEQRQSKVPQLSDLRESGSLEQDTDMVIFIYRDEVYNPDTERPGQADFIIAKHRNGPIGEVTTTYKKSQTCFEDLPSVTVDAD